MQKDAGGYGEQTPESVLQEFLTTESPVPLVSSETPIPTKGDQMFDLSPERKNDLFGQIDATAQFFSRFEELSKEPAYLAGGLSVSLGMEHDIYRDQTDVDVEMDASQRQNLFRFSRKEGYLVIDPQTGKQLFSPDKTPRRISLIKSKTSEAVGPNLCEVYFFTSDQHDTVASAFLDLPFPKDLYENAKIYKTESNNSIRLSPIEVQLVYKICYSMLYARPEDIADIRRFVPKLSEEQYELFKKLAGENISFALDRVRKTLQT